MAVSEQAANHNHWHKEQGSCILNVYLRLTRRNAICREKLTRPTAVAADRIVSTSLLPCWENEACEYKRKRALDSALASRDIIFNQAAKEVNGLESRPNLCSVFSLKKIQDFFLMTRINRVNRTCGKRRKPPTLHRHD
jgi:hypothetical protein